MKNYWFRLPPFAKGNCCRGELSLRKDGVPKSNEVVLL